MGAERRDLPPADHMVLAVCGLKREAEVIVGPERMAISGDSATLRGLLAEFAHHPPMLILSWGLCGGLDPALRPGDILIGAEVVGDGERIATDSLPAAALLRRLLSAGVAPRMATFAAADVPVLAAAAKFRLRAETGAAAVDTESLLAARWARELAAPFAILRAVSDPAGRNLPPLVAKAVDPAGRVNVWSVIAALARSPSQLPGLLAAARDSSAAFAALKRCSRVPGLFLGLGQADLG